MHFHTEFMSVIVCPLARHNALLTIYAHFLIYYLRRMNKYYLVQTLLEVMGVFPKEYLQLHFITCGSSIRDSLM